MLQFVGKLLHFIHPPLWTSPECKVIPVKGVLAQYQKKTFYSDVAGIVGTNVKIMNMLILQGNDAEVLALG